jgi:hypothetical protein
MKTRMAPCITTPVWKNKGTTVESIKLDIGMEEWKKTVTLSLLLSVEVRRQIPRPSFRQ